MHLTFFILYFAVLLSLGLYGLHRSHLVMLYLRHKKRVPLLRAGRSVKEGETLPTVTIQLPLYNEATVVARLLQAVAKMDYPRDKFEVQVLDDSTDETRFIVDREVEKMRRQGVDAVVVRRPNREGYKAGALEYGLKTAKGELVAIFDADFIPQPDFLRSMVSEFRDPTVAMVQSRWGHINREHSLLTKVQALMLDGHHLGENRARFAAGRLFNFSGTGGIWRVEAIRDAGGWQHDTLTEDLDLSYRAQLKGWRFVYREDVVTPSELPEDVSALRAQQYRWARGTVQTARKLLGTVLRSDLTLAQRVEAFFHFTPHFAYPLMVVLSILLLPALLLTPATNFWTMVEMDLPLAIGTTGSLALFYGVAERARGGKASTALWRLPSLIALGMGMAPYLSKAVWDGLQMFGGEFVRTPKKGTKEGRYRSYTALPFPELILFFISAASVVAAWNTGHWFALPFASLFAFGYGYVAVLTFREQVARRRASLQTAQPTARVAS